MSVRLRASGRSGQACLLVALSLWVAVLGWPGAALAQSEVDLFGGFGNADTAEADDLPAPGTRMKPGEGAVIGRVFNAETGSSIRGVTVILMFPASVAGATPRQEVQATNSDGAFEFPSVPPASGYKLNFVKSGFRSAELTAFAVISDTVKRADFPLPPIAAAEASSVLDLEAFVVDEAVAGQLMQNLELRLESDSMLNLMSAEDLARFAASDVADALKRVAGVNIVEGQFAIIRGLEDRYSSTLYNGAPIPSPDPDRQSVQLDLFPSEIVNNIGVSKTFTPELPSNSAGGSIDIFTHEYPDEFVFKLSAAAGYNTNAINEFLEYTPGNPVGQPIDGAQTAGMEYGALVGGRFERWKREFRLQGIFNYEDKYRTAKGFQETRRPRDGNQSVSPTIQRNGGLLVGLLNNSGSRYDLLQSTYTQQWTGYAGFGFDLDEEANHQIDGSVFYAKNNQDIVQRRENGFIYSDAYGDDDAYDYGPLIEQSKDEPDDIQLRNQYLGPERRNLGDGDLAFSQDNWFLTSSRDDIFEQPGRFGGVWWAPNAQSQSFERSRDLLITQLNGASEFPRWEGFTVDWAANWARTKQDERSRRLRFFYEPDDVEFALQDGPGGAAPIDAIGDSGGPLQPVDLGPGLWTNQFSNVLSSGADVVEKQGFGRVDLGYEWELSEDWLFEFKAGGWYERSKRSVDAFFLETPTAVGGGSEAIAQSATQYGLGFEAFDILVVDPETGDLAGTRSQESEAVRQVGALGLSAKATMFEDFDVFAGIRMENLQLSTENDPFTGATLPNGDPQLTFGAPATFPSVYLFGDRIDNPNDRTPNLPQNNTEIPGGVRPGTVFNDQLLGLDFPPNNFQNGEFYRDLITPEQISDFASQSLSEWNLLPSIGTNWRFYEGAVARFSFSDAAARPSLRELGYYVSVEPGSDDLVVGNPYLGLSQVRSVDGRLEYSWGDFGDLVGFSAFWKKIEDPIESLIIQNPIDASGSSSAFYRTFFNNGNDAKLWGIEAEVRKNLGFEGFSIGEYFSIGGNFTWIEARVRRDEVEVQRFSPFFLDGSATPGTPGVNTLVGDRRLFGQPQWIANADITFNQEDWGTAVTLAYFGISDVLDAAGNAGILRNGEPSGVGQLDRYTAAFYQLDLVISQRIEVDFVPGAVGLKVSAKNLTNSQRGIVYDTAQTQNEYYERRFRVGRDFKFSISYTW